MKLNTLKPAPGSTHKSKRIGRGEGSGHGGTSTRGMNGAKSKGSSNPHNLVKATVAALTQMRDAYTVAGLRGIPMSKVFKG